MTTETTLYSGELSGDVYQTFADVVDELHPWMDADVDVILESNGEDRLRVEGETRSLLNPLNKREVSETYGLDTESAEYLRQAFE
jgi:hypothetical protein